MLEQRKTKRTFPRDTKKEKCIWGWVVNPRAFTLQHSPSPFFRHTVTRGHCSIFARMEFSDALQSGRQRRRGGGGCPFSYSGANPFFFLWTDLCIQPPPCCHCTRFFVGFLTLKRFSLHFLRLHALIALLLSSQDAPTVAGLMALMCTTVRTSLSKGIALKESLKMHSKKILFAHRQWGWH